MILNLINAGLPKYNHGDIYYTIIPIVFFVLCLVFGIVLLCGKGGILIPGYNQKAKGEEAIKHEKFYCKKVGIFVMILTIFFAIIFVGVIFQIYVLAAIGGGLGAIYAIFGVVALKNNVKAQKAKLIAKELTESYEKQEQENNNDLLQ